MSEHIWCDDYLVRSFYLKNLQTNETRTVTQFHFLTWPDLDVPKSIKALLDFRRYISTITQKCPTNQLSFFLSFLNLKVLLKFPSYQSTDRHLKVSERKVNRVTNIKTIFVPLSLTSSVETFSIISKCRWNLEAKLSM